MTPSERLTALRLAALHQLNRQEEVARAREVSSLVAFVSIGIFLAMIFHVLAIIGAPTP